MKIDFEENTVGNSNEWKQTTKNGVEPHKRDADQHFRLADGSLVHQRFRNGEEVINSQSANSEKGGIVRNDREELPDALQQVPVREPWLKVSSNVQSSIDRLHSDAYQEISQTQ